MDYSFSFHSLEHFFVIVAWSCFPSLWHLPSISALWHIFNWQPTIENIVVGFSHLLIFSFIFFGPALPDLVFPNAICQQLNGAWTSWNLDTRLKKSKEYIFLWDYSNYFVSSLFLKYRSGFISLVQWTMRKYERLRDETACHNNMNISFFKEEVGCGIGKISQLSER